MCMRIRKMLEHITNINLLSEQIEALLDLMQTAENQVDIRSIRTASEMCANMHLELMEEIKAIYEESKEEAEHKEAMDNATLAAAGINSDGFMNIPDDIEKELPYSQFKELKRLSDILRGVEHE